MRQHTVEQAGAPTSIFSGPCIFSCAAKAFLKGVGVLGVGIMTVLRNLGVLELGSWQIMWSNMHPPLGGTLVIVLTYFFTHRSLSGAWVWFLFEVVCWRDTFGHTWELRWGRGYPGSYAPPLTCCKTGVTDRQTSYLSYINTSQAEVGIQVCGGKNDLIYPWWGERQWLGGRFLGRIWYIFQKGGAGPVTQRRWFPSFFPPPPPNWALARLGWIDRSEGGDTAQTKWSTGLILTRDGRWSVDRVAQWTINRPVLQETGVACLVVPWWCRCLWHIETGHVAPWNRVLQKTTHLQ